MYYVMSLYCSFVSEWKLEMVYVTFWSQGLNRDNVGQCLILKSFNRLTLEDQKTKQNLQAIDPELWKEENAISGVIPTIPRLSVLI